MSILFFAIWFKVVLIESFKRHTTYVVKGFKCLLQIHWYWIGISEPRNVFGVDLPCDLHYLKLIWQFSRQWIHIEGVWLNANLILWQSSLNLFYFFSDLLHVFLFGVEEALIVNDLKIFNFHSMSWTIVKKDLQSFVK